MKIKITSIVYQRSDKFNKSDFIIRLFDGTTGQWRTDLDINKACDLYKNAKKFISTRHYNTATCITENVTFTATRISYNRIEIKIDLKEGNIAYRYTDYVSIIEFKRMIAILGNEIKFIKTKMIDRLIDSKTI